MTDISTLAKAGNGLPSIDLTDIAAILERAIVGGDLSGMTPEDRLRYYERTCRSLGLNPLTKPFQYVTLRTGGPMVLYPTVACAEQLRKIYGVSLVVQSARRDEDDIYTVTVLATLPTGRREQATGAVYVGGVREQPLANLKMKAESKAKRRATLAIVGLGFLDAPEAEDRVRTISIEQAHAALPAGREGQINDLDSTIDEVIDHEGIGARGAEAPEESEATERPTTEALPTTEPIAASAVRWTGSVPPVAADIPPAWREAYDQRVTVARELNEAAGTILVVIPSYPQSRGEMQGTGRALAEAIARAKEQLAGPARRRTSEAVAHP